jgi:hypothetical protein
MPGGGRDSITFEGIWYGEAAIYFGESRTSEEVPVPESFELAQSCGLSIRTAGTNHRMLLSQTAKPAQGPYRTITRA